MLHSIALATLVATQVYWENPSTHEHGEGFSDSSFNYVSDKKFCFIGRAKDVCPIVDRAANEMRAQYSNGAHDTIEILSCTVKNEVVTVHYLLSDDYHPRDLDVTRVIEDCTK